jgi:hypothetical protein
MKIKYLFIFKQKSYGLIWAAIVVLGTLTGFAQDTFPFQEIPDANGLTNTFRTTINVNDGTSRFNAKLLGGNLDFNSASTGRASIGPSPSSPNDTRGGQGFNAFEVQPFTDTYRQTVIRFPQGVWAHSYNWEATTVGGQFLPADSRVYPRANLLLRNSLNNRKNPADTIRTEHVETNAQIRMGYPGLVTLLANAKSNNRRIDLLTPLNIVNNDEMTNRRRYERMIMDSLDVEDFELGNEFFFIGQRSKSINTNEKFTTRANAIIREIRNSRFANGRTVRFGLPLSHRPSPLSEAQLSNDTLVRSERVVVEHGVYNEEMISGMANNYNAIVLHRYVRENRKTTDTTPRSNDPNLLKPKNLARLMRAGRIIEESINYCRSLVPANRNRVWLTEWGVAGTNSDNVGAAVLGAANAYMHLIKNRSSLGLDRMNWFTTFGSNATHLVMNTKTNTTYSLTGYGKIQNTLVNNLVGKNMFDNIDINTPTLNYTGNDESSRETNAFLTKAVNAIAVRTTNNSITYLITNLANKATRVSLDINDSREEGFSVSQTGFGVRQDLRQLDQVIDLPNAGTTLNNRNFLSIPPRSFVRAVVTFNSAISAKTGNDTKSTTETLAKNISIAPNPSGSSFDIALQGFNAAHVVISDLLGKIVYTANTIEGKVTLSKGNTFKTGVYLVTATDDKTGQVFNSKLVIN